MAQDKVVYFVGIGGIGMSALAQLYCTQGMRVSGSDRSASVVTKLLTEKGAEVHIGHDARQVPHDCTLLVYSDAVPEDNEERIRARELGARELSYFEALGEATKEGVSIVVSGTHGKTTTTAMLAKVLIENGKNPTVIAGSILSEYGSNFVAGKHDLFVIEGCEYRRHFLELHPDVLVINNIELDHTDYFTDLDDMKSAFRELIARMPEKGVIVANTADQHVSEVVGGAAQAVESTVGVAIPELLARGEYNQDNARAAKAAASTAFPDLTESAVDASLATFSGTWRRFEFKGETESGAMVFDDYAHHPTAVAKVLSMLRKEYVDKKHVVVFHPHLYSRTKEFFNEFVDALAEAEEVILLPIFAAREAHDPTVSSEVLVEAINYKGGNARYCKDFTDAEMYLQEKEADTLILTMGAGDVYLLGEQLLTSVE